MTPPLYLLDIARQRESERRRRSLVPLRAAIAAIVLAAIVFFAFGVIVGQARTPRPQGQVTATLQSVAVIPASLGAPRRGDGRGDPDASHRESRNHDPGTGAPGIPVSSAPLVTGYATHYRAPSGHGAAGPALRAALGPAWRGAAVTVCAGTCLGVRLTDLCACGPRHGRPTVIDLPIVDFARLAEPSRGIVVVTVSTGLAPPATDR